MKHLKYKTGISLISPRVIAMGSCTKDFETINTPPQGATDAPMPQYIMPLSVRLPLASGEYSVMNSWMYPITQQAIVTSGDPIRMKMPMREVWHNFFTALANYRLVQSRDHPHLLIRPT